jgi:dienelactone hydrolase
MSSIRRRLMGLAVPLVVATGRLLAQSAPERMLPLPLPGGQYAVATRIAHLVDSARGDSDFPNGRPITVQAWYPTTRTAGARARYLPDQGLGAALVRSGYYGIDSTTLRVWDTLQTHSVLDGPPAPGNHPAVTFSVGLGVIRANYTTLAEGLASNGYVVIAVESPLAGLMVLPGGSIVSDTAGRGQEPAVHRQWLVAWSRDISSVIDRLFAGRIPSLAPISAAIDRRRVGAAGHSSGGLVALETCRLDRRFTACIDLDGGLAAPTGEPICECLVTGLDRPSLMLRSRPVYSDEDFAKRGTTREKWLARNRAGGVAFDSMMARSRGALVAAAVEGTGHFNFSDAPFVMPSAINRFGGRIIDGTRGYRLILATMIQFFDRAFAGDVRPSLAAVAARFPELKVEDGR